MPLTRAPAYCRAVSFVSSAAARISSSLRRGVNGRLQVCEGCLRDASRYNFDDGTVHCRNAFL